MRSDDNYNYMRIKKYDTSKAERFKELAYKRVGALIEGDGSFTIDDLNEMDRISTPYFHLEVNGIPLRENEK